MKKTIALFAFIIVAAMAAFAADNGKFVIKGSVDPDMTETSYVIYISDDPDFDTAQSVEEVPVTDGKFVYETTLEKMKFGRLRAKLPNGELAPTWVDLKFTPDFTLRLAMHNGYYNVINEAEYYRKVNENIVGSDAYAAQLGGTIVVKDALDSNITFVAKENAVSNYQRAEALKLQLESYKMMIDIITEQIRTTAMANVQNDLYKQLEQVLNKMQEAVKDYQINFSD